MIEKINDYISYIPATEIPLSADVGIVTGRKCVYLYDVGSTYECLDYLYSLKGRVRIVISHFHADHTWWLTKHHPDEPGMKPGDEISLNYKRPEFERLYIGKGTEKYLRDGEIIREPLMIEDESLDGKPLKIEIFPMPSSHSVGSLAMSVNEEYIFMGDSTYCRYISKKEGEEDHTEYNVQKLKAQIDLLKTIKADKCLISHEKKIVRPKKVIIRQLEAIYSKRNPGENIIKLKSSPTY